MEERKVFTKNDGAVFIQSLDLKHHHNSKTTGTALTLGYQGKEGKRKKKGGVAPTSSPGGRAGKGENPAPESAGALGCADGAAELLLPGQPNFFGTSKPK